MEFIADRLGQYVDEMLANGINGIAGGPPELSPMDSYGVRRGWAGGSVIVVLGRSRMAPL